MRLAVFADIHANIEAMQAVATDFKDQRIDRYICLGDLIGYGPNPNACIDLVRSLPNAIVVQGNHDAAVTWGATPYGMSKDAQQAIFWSMDRLRKDNIVYLEQLETTRTMGKMIFSHASPYNPKAWRYLTTRKYATRAFSGTSAKLLFVGHTHKPLVITRHNYFSMSFTTPEASLVNSVCSGASRQIFNCGSVGQPRDGIPLACYLLYDTRLQEITYRRVAYNHQKTAEKILSAGLPAFPAKRLARGK